MTALRSRRRARAYKTYVEFGDAGEVLSVQPDPPSQQKPGEISGLEVNAFMHCAGGPILEWLEGDGRGAFACGTVSGVPARRYHNVLMHAASPSNERLVLVNDVEAWLTVAGQRVSLDARQYDGGMIAPETSLNLEAFDAFPWPKWNYRLPNGASLTRELFIERATRRTFLRWRFEDLPEACEFNLRLLMSCRDYHHERRRDEAFDFTPSVRGLQTQWKPYLELPAIQAVFNGKYRHEPDWYYRVLYALERERGFEALEDLASPGRHVRTLEPPNDEAVLILSAQPSEDPESLTDYTAVQSVFERARSTERDRRTRLSTERLAADAYIAARNSGATIVAGFPWFTDWGRDTFIAIRGLCIASGRLDDAERILLTWANTISEGMIPNCFPDGAREPAFNSVDASLWFVVAAYEYMTASSESTPNRAKVDTILWNSIDSILYRYEQGARFGIRADKDGLLAAGVPGEAVTWMDARVMGEPVTPRVGKPVEVQCLWLNALQIAAQRRPKWTELFERATSSFVTRFWRPDGKYLYDVVDVDHIPGKVDDSVRPNQIFAAGGLPYRSVPHEMAKSVVSVVERELLTPLGLRTLSPRHPDYCPRYEGGPAERDAKYHQGTVWPWLMGPFIEAWLRVNTDRLGAQSEAHTRFLAPIERHLSEAGIGHISEICDGDGPHRPRGCPFQAWSLGEYIRAKKLCGADVSFHA